MARVTLLSAVPSAKVMPPDTAAADVAPAPVVPPVTFGVPSGWHKVFTDEPPLVPWPALTQIVMFFLAPASERYRTAAPVLILENSAYFQDGFSFTSPLSAQAPWAGAAVVFGTSVVIYADDR